MIDELPQGWSTASLSDIADINPRHPRDLDDDLLVSFAPMPALSESRPDFRELRERPLSEVRKGFTHFAEGDVLFAKITPCMENGKAAVARRLRSGLGCGTTELHVLRPLAGVEPLYIYHFIHQPSFRRDAEANFTGTAGQLRVPVAFIESAEIPLAPLAEQRRIVAKLEKLLGKVDACQQRLTKIPILLKRLRQSVLAAACSGRLTADWREENRTGEEWSDVRLGDVAELVSGAGFPLVHQRKQGLRYPFFKVGNLGDVESGQELTTSEHSVDDALVRKLRAKVIPKGATVFAKIGMAMGPEPSSPNWETCLH
jgi:type I restriction enzyme S subunit